MGGGDERQELHHSNLAFGNACSVCLAQRYRLRGRPLLQECWLRRCVHVPSDGRARIASAARRPQCLSEACGVFTRLCTPWHGARSADSETLCQSSSARAFSRVAQACVQSHRIILECPEIGVAFVSTTKQVLVDRRSRTRVVAPVGAISDQLHHLLCMTAKLSKTTADEGRRRFFTTHPFFTIHRRRRRDERRIRHAVDMARFAALICLLARTAAEGGRGTPPISVAIGLWCDVDLERPRDRPRTPLAARGRSTTPTRCCMLRAPHHKNCAAAEAMGKLVDAAADDTAHERKGMTYFQRLAADAEAARQASARAVEGRRRKAAEEAGRSD